MQTAAGIPKSGVASEVQQGWVQHRLIDIVSVEVQKVENKAKENTYLDLDNSGSWRKEYEV